MILFQAVSDKIRDARLDYGEMFLLIINDNVRHHHQLNGLGVIQWCAVINQRKQILHSFLSQFVLVFSDYPHNPTLLYS